MAILYNVAKYHTNQSISNLLKMQLVNIKDIKIRRYFFVLILLNTEENEVDIIPFQKFLFHDILFKINIKTY